MSDSIRLRSFLSSAEIEALRSRARQKRKAVSLAPQLVELVTVLTEQLQDALNSIEEVRAAAGDLASGYENGLVTGTRCPACQNAKVRAALMRLQRALEAKPSASE